MSAAIAREIAAQVSEETGVSVRDILSRVRLRDVSAARNMVYYRLRTRGWTYGQIGLALDRDPTSVLQGVRMAIHQAKKFRAIAA